MTKFTATGHISCFQPNLQTIPIRTEEGRAIRKALTHDIEIFDIKPHPQDVEFQKFMDHIMDELCRGHGAKRK